MDNQTEEKVEGVVSETEVSETPVADPGPSADGGAVEEVV